MDPDKQLDLRDSSNVRRWKAYIREAVESLSPKNWQCNNERRGFAYNLRSVFRFSGDSRGEDSWLDSDGIWMGILSIQKEMDESLKSFVFFMPTFEWDVGYFRRLRSRERGGTSKTGGSEGEFRNRTEYFVDLLRRQREPVALACASHLSNAVIYAVVNKGECHWVAVEACVRAREALVYDPAGVGLPETIEGAERYFFKLRGVLEALLHEKKIADVEKRKWNCTFADGGQQDIALDSVNCGIYSLEWIRFRIRTAVKPRAVREQKQGFTYLPERLRETRMRPLEECEKDARRLRLARDALSEIKRLQYRRLGGSTL